MTARPTKFSDTRPDEINRFDELHGICRSLFNKFLAVERILAGCGYEIGALDLITACENFMAAAYRLGMIMEAKGELAEIIARYPDAPSLFRSVVSTLLNDGMGAVPSFDVQSGEDALEI